MTTKAFGQAGFRWFVGVVEDRDDPEKLGRVRLRIYGVHGDATLVPTELLPWASVLMPATSSSLNHVGVSPTGLQVGSTVTGFFMDGNECNMPIVFGVLPGLGDVTPLAQGNQIIQKSPKGPEPESSFAAAYPYNKVIQTESGHVIEIDDTPNNQRLHIYHRAGTYVEINPDGSVTMRVSKDVKTQVDGNYTLNVDGNIKIDGKTINLNSGTKGAARLDDSVDTGDGGGAHADGSNKIEGSSKTVFIGD